MGIHESLTTVDFVVVVIYVIAVLSLGFWVSFRKKHTDDLFLAGRQLGWFNIGLSIFGTNISPSMMIVSCGVAYSSGIVAANFEWLAWIFLFLLAMLFVPYYLSMNISTMPEFLGRRYGNSCRVFLSWYTMFSTLWLWVGGTLFIGGVLMSQIFDCPLWMSVVFLTIIATSFTVAGGLAAVVITDSFQSILMIVASTALTIIAFFKVGGVAKLVSSVPADYWQLFRPADDTVFPWPAIIFGYPVMGIWFWCTDQTIVQRVLGGRNTQQGQLGAVFAGFLKILPPLIFFMPGILCKVLYPNLSSSNEAYMTMVVNCLPAGAVGLIVAVLIAALVSTVDSGLNSLSTVFTLDIYCRKFRPQAAKKEIIWVGRIVTATGGAVGILVALAFNSIKNMDLFTLGQSMIGFLAPSMAVVFLAGVLWKRATSTAAFATLVGGTPISLTIAVFYLFVFPGASFWPHYLLMSFYLFVGLMVFMIVVSLLTKKPLPDTSFHSLKEIYVQQGRDGHSKNIVLKLWFLLAAVMVTLYLIFN